MRSRRFSILAWSSLAYVLLVILWGAYVRATGSGAGCGSHWPLCNGEVLPRSAEAATWIEFTHRLSSGLALVLVVWLAFWAFRAYPPKSPVRRFAAASLFFMITEALIGAGLVLFELVAENASLARGMAMAAHLGNTFLLLAAMLLLAWSAQPGRTLRLDFHRPLGGWLAGLLAALLLLGASGAVTALGDTLFLQASPSQELSAPSHLLIRLRIHHPWIALAVGLYLIAVTWRIRFHHPGPCTLLLARFTLFLYLLQLSLGALNVLLKAPVWLQLVHLLFSDLIWLSAVLLCTWTLNEEPSPGPGSRLPATRLAKLS